MRIRIWIIDGEPSDVDDQGISAVPFDMENDDAAFDLINLALENGHSVSIETIPEGIPSN